MNMSAPKTINGLSDLFINSNARGPRLRVGVMVDDFVIISAFAEVLRDIQRSNFVDLALVVVHEQEKLPVAAPRSLASRVWSMLRRPGFFRMLGWDLYSRFDARYFPAKHDPCAMEDCTHLLAGVQRMDVKPIAKGFTHRFPDDVVDAIRRYDLDVILRFGFNIIRGDILKAARFGMWSFHHGDNDEYRGGPAHFWELVEDNPLSGVILQVLTEELDAGLVLAKGKFATSPGISLIRNRVQPYWGSVHMVIQKLWELHNFGWEQVARACVPPSPYRGRRKLYRRPTTSEVVGWLIPTMVRKAVRRAARGLFSRPSTDHWRMAIRRVPESETHLPIDMRGFQWVESPKDHFYADPFLYEHEGRTHLFFEDYKYSAGRAVIDHAVVQADGSLGEVSTVLDTGSHASYPLVVADHADIYMLPETIQDGGARLYRAVDFPKSWAPAHDVILGPVVDSTIFRYDERWWTFTTVREPRGRALALCLFWADAIAGPWKAHPLNPLSLDVRTARGAGSVMHTNLGLVRPSQDCSGRYGKSFSLHVITHLSTTDYREELLQTVDASWSEGLLTTHTFNRGGGFDVTDGQIRRASI